MYPAPHIHEHFTIHKWLRQTAYILTHNLSMLEHIANNGMLRTTEHDARRLDVLLYTRSYIALVAQGSSLALCVIPLSSMHAHLCLVA